MIRNPFRFRAAVSKNRAVTSAIASAVELLEDRTLYAGDLRSFDGAGNNQLNPRWGAAGTALLRLVKAQYTDGIAAPSGAARPSARLISNTVAAHPVDEEMVIATHLSAFGYLWGQFIDHDLDLTTTASSAGSFNVKVPKGDLQFDPLGTGTAVIPLNRSNFAPGTGVNSARQQVNSITAFLDGSMVYGSDASRAKALRALVGGRLLTSAGDLLPFNTTGLTNANDAHLFDADELFVAGDVRANENSELTSLHTLFLREHNRLAGLIAARNTGWTDEQIYQQARRLVIGEIQAITYNEFLPALLGPNALHRYSGYDPNVNAGVSNEFSTAAFRLGHSMLADDVEFITNEGEDAREEMALAEVFFNPAVVQENGIDTILKYLASSNSEEIDNIVVDGVRNFLFGPPGAGGLDLASLNIQRGREHGLGDYNSTRKAVGLAPVSSFNQITSDEELAAKLQSLYGSVDKVDLWVGGLAEDHARGSNVGVTFQRILVEQFTRTRSGDRFWYERDLKGADLRTVRGTSLAKIIAANTGISNLQPNVFVFDVQITGKIYNDHDGNGQPGFGEAGIAGVTVELLADDGTVIDTVVTGRDGRYLITDVSLGNFQVHAVLPANSLSAALATASIDVTRGGTIGNVNFGLTSAGGTGSAHHHGHHSAPHSASPHVGHWTASWLDSHAVRAQWKDLLA